MTRLLYNLLFPLALVVILPRYLTRMLRRGNFRRDFGQRFARYTPNLRAELSQGDWIWVHAVSVGELLIALKVLRELHRRHPSWRFVVSSTTSTAHALALGQCEPWWIPVYTPIDFLPIVRRALEQVRPRAVILTEGEMWPNFVWESARRGCPILLVNARVSPRSEQRYRRFARFLRPMTQHLAAVGLQEKEHAALWSLLGVPTAHLHFTGSVKFDPDGPIPTPHDFRPILNAHGLEGSTPILLGGSTHEGEEEILANALLTLRRSHPSLRLLIAPRHVERTGDILARLSATGLRIALRSALPGAEPPDILLIDTTGELQDWYHYADVVFIGKSLTGIGGQNPVEAILAGRPVLFGPHMENFATLRRELLAAKGAMEVHDAPSLAAAADAILSDPAHRTALALHATQTLQSHQGATARTASLIEQAILEE